MDFTFSPYAGIAIAAVLGGAIGIQRQASAKPAGFRTHLLVSTAAAAFTAMGAHLHDTRIPSYIVVGIGFLGAGAIVREGAEPRGLTTAASIWAASAIGLLMGYSNSFGLIAALLVSAITLVALSISDARLMSALRISSRATLKVTCTLSSAPIENISQLFRMQNVRYEQAGVVSVRAEGAAETTDLCYIIHLGPGPQLNRLVHEISSMTGVHRVEATDPFWTP